MRPTCVVIIPARGGSKGVPRKALRRIAGETLIARCVRTCAGASRVDRVVVSTEDSEIAEEAGRAGAFVLQRPPELATDVATTASVLLHAADHTSQTIMVCVQCCAPLLTSAELNGAIGKLIDTHADCVAIAAETNQWQCVESPERCLVPIGWYTGAVARRQDRRPTYCLDGSAFAFWAAAFAQRGEMWGERNLLYVVRRRALDIDTEDDLLWARAIIERKQDLTEAGPIE